jgi:hypothetical protein
MYVELKIFLLNKILEKIDVKISFWLIKFFKLNLLLNLSGS